MKKTGLFLAMTGMVLSVMVTPFSVLADVQTEELPTGLFPVEEIAIKADDSELYESSDELLSETALYYAQIYDEDCGALCKGERLPGADYRGKHRTGCKPDHAEPCGYQ